MTNEFLRRIKQNPENIEFSETIEVIDTHYIYTPTRFSNGNNSDDRLINEAGSNEGSCKIFAFAKLNNLSVAQTLQCFGVYYREDVLKHPEEDNHANIRRFIRDGWQGIHFEQSALQIIK